MASDEYNKKVHLEVNVKKQATIFKVYMSLFTEQFWNDDSLYQKLELTNL